MHLAGLSMVLFPGPEGRDARSLLAETSERCIAGADGVAAGQNDTADQEDRVVEAVGRAERAAVRAAYDAVQRLRQPSANGPGMDRDTRNAIDLDFALREGL